MKMILTLSVISIVILACGDNERPVIEPVVVAPEPKPIKPNLSAPVIKKIVVPDQVHAGDRVKIQAAAEDPDGNTLTYNWEAPGKLIYTVESLSVAIWTVPINMDVATINVTVNDGIHEVKKSVDVRVNPALIVAEQEAAGIKLTDRLNHVIDLYGEPSSQVDFDDLGIDRTNMLGEKVIIWDTKREWKNDGLTVYFKGSRVLGIVISAPNTTLTAGGNGIGSTCDDIRNELKATLKNKVPWLHMSGGPNFRDDYHSYIWVDYGIEIRCRLGVVLQIVISEVFPGWEDYNYYF